MSILGIGISGLNAAQVGLLTTGNNISNASTPGYNRQQIIQSANTPLVSGAGFIGQGTNVSSVSRIYNSFLSSQLMASQSTAAALSTFSAQIGQIDNMLANNTTGLSPAMQQFFTAVGAAAANPSDVPSRQAVLSGAQGLVSAFQSVDQQLSGIGSGINKQISSEVTTINAYVQQLADVNQKLINAQSSSAKPANDLLDQRDQIVSNLNKEVNVTTQLGSDGSYTVFFGSGQPLLVGTMVTKLLAVPAAEDLSRTEVAMQDSNGRVTNVPETLVSGGNLAGLMRFRSQTLDAAQNSLGRIATVFAANFNAQQMLGQDMNGALGKAFFNTSTATEMRLPNPGNLGTADIGVTLTNPADLNISDYRLTMTAANTLSLTRLSDNITWSGTGASQTQAMTNLMTQLGGSAQGFSLAFTSTSGPMSIGDSFLVQPTRNGARDISVALTDTNSIALAAPVLTAAGGTNAGTAVISPGAVSSIASGLAAPFNISYEASSSSFLGFPTGATVVVGGQSYQITSPSMRVPYTAGSNISLDGVGVSISGAPADGDSFTIAPSGPASLFGTLTAGVAGGQATATGNQTLVNPTTITTGVNDKFTIAVDGAAATAVTIPAGSYTPAALATQLQTSINTAVAPKSVTVTVNGSNQLIVTSATVGPPSAVIFSNANQGTGTMAAGTVTSTNTLPVKPVTLAYSQATNSLSGFPVGAIVTVNGTQTTISSPTTAVAYTSGATISFNGISFSISGVPSNGDSYTVGPNTSGVSDNRNAQLLGALQTKKAMSQGTETYVDSYAQIVSQIGNTAREVNVNSSAQDTLVQQQTAAVQSVSGVNLDEEAANLLNYQQAYQASAKIITIAGKLFDTLLAI